MYRKMFYSIVITLLTHGYCSAMNPEQVLNPAVLEAVTAHHLDQDKEYLDVHRAPLLILFSGCAGMGKTTTAQTIQRIHKTLCFDAFDTRVVLRNKYQLFHENLPAEERVSKMLACFGHFLAKVKETIPNKAVIFDESIDRQEPKPALFERMQAIAQSHAFPLFVIRLQVPREIVCKRLMRREEQSAHNTEHFKARFDMYYDLYEAFDTSRVHYFLDNSAESEKSLSDNHELIKMLAPLR